MTRQQVHTPVKTIPLLSAARRRNCKLAARGFSLLEVVIATAILAASAVMLMSMFSTGDRHTSRADERVIAQMLCQSKLDELLADPSQILPIQADVLRQYPGWIWSLEIQPTSLEKFVQLTVSVTRIPGMPTGADLELASVQTQSADSESAGAIDNTSLTSIPDEPTYKLVRWIRFEGDIDSFKEGPLADVNADQRTMGGL